MSKLLHVGTVQDFRIKTDELRQVINKTFRDSEQMEIDESELENEQQMNDDDDDSKDSDDDTTEMQSTSNNAEGSDNDDDENQSKSATTSITSGTPTPTNQIVEDASDDDSAVTTKNALTHLAAINKRVSKRRKRAGDANENATAGPAGKRTLRKR